jgi:chromosome segregation ATPase
MTKISIRFATRAAAAALMLGLAAPALWAQAAPDAKQVRRLQMQLQSAQQQLQETQAAKGKIEADKTAADKAVAEQARQAGALKGQLRKASDEFKAAEAERARLAAAVAALEKQLAEQKMVAEEALAQKGRELAQFTRARDEQQTQLQRLHDQQVALVGECTAKNTRLIQLSAELVDQYRGKTVADVIKQRDVVLGLGDVQMFNLVQNYRDKAEAERFVQSTNR